MDYLTTHTSLSPIRRGFAPGFVNYKKGGLDSQPQVINKVYQLLAHGRWFSPGTPASSTTKTGHHDIAEILLKMALNTKNQSDKTKQEFCVKQFYDDLVYYLIFKSWIIELMLLYCLSFFDLRLLITPLIFSNFSYTDGNFCVTKIKYVIYIHKVQD